MIASFDRRLGDLTADEIATNVVHGSILCLAFGSYEQHGPHLPVATDALVAERIAERVVERYGEEYDLWLLPSLPFGYSPEHSGAAGCIGLDLDTCLTLLRGLCCSLRAACSARRLLIVNGHGGNRPLLDAVIYELERAYDLDVAVSHPSALSGVRSGSARAEIHAGKSETSVMLALAPELVHLDRVGATDATSEEQAAHVREQVLDRGITTAWSSSDPALSTSGVLGDPTQADAALGERIVTEAVEAHRRVLDYLRARR
jgi:creatinine amidohydrolase